MVNIKRVYEPPESSDGTRILVDRLWPRGLSKAAAALDEWNKEVAPSPALRTWFGHDPARFEEFTRRYEHELSANHAAASLRRRAGSESITLLYAAKDQLHNHALVLQQFLSRS